MHLAVTGDQSVDIRSGKRDVLVDGHVEKGFEYVREQFERNFRERGEQGAACAIYHQGERVVDLWGGTQCEDSQVAWSPETLTLCFSVTKGMAAAALAVAHSQSLFELDQTVATYWPEFAKQGKEQITVRQLLSHQAGLVTTGRPLEADQLADQDGLAEILQNQRPLWEPGSRHGYHTLTLGWYQSELLRRIDPLGRSIGVFFQQEIAERLGIEFYIGLPRHISLGRLSTIQGFHRYEMLGHLHELPPMMVLSGILPNSLVSKSIRTLKINNPAEIGSEKYRHLEIPSANGFGQAIAVAKVYEVLARGGKELGLRSETYRELIAPPTTPRDGNYDAILKMDTSYQFGFSRPSRGMPFGSDSTAFGCPGAGGSFGMADPSHRAGFAYITNKMGFRLSDDPREKAVRDAFYECIGANAQQRQIA
ncbi:Beta-lactamase precursor [Novipirellula aureliae]|uniref:Beta-lactamase n=2 Tax=Novipirellula aureliae TaxID=2527966 RepID=A0A5C6E9H7_9BACT|nr:Beta-lactamase precursor [Novipirellula aureliae]